MIRLPRFLLLLSLTAPTALGQDALPATQPSASPAAPTPELPTAPEASAPVDPLTSKPPVGDDRAPDAASNPDSQRLPDPFKTPPSLPMPVETKPTKESDVREVKIVYLKNSEAKTVQSIVYDIFGADVTPGVDSRTNALVLSGPAAKLNEALALVDTLDTAEPTPAAIQDLQKPALSSVASRELKKGPAERRVSELLEERRLSLSLSKGKASIGEKEISLREAIAAAFDERQAQQLAEIEELSARLQKLSQTVQSRQANRQQMIERRLNDLLNPENQETTDEDPLHSEDKRLPKAGGPFVTDEIQKSVYSYGAAFRGVLYFRADWVAPCKEMDKTIERLQSDGAHIETIDIDEGSEVVKQFKVEVVPSLVFIREGKVHSVIKGLTSYEDIRAQFDPMSHEFRPQENIGHVDSQRVSGSGLTSNAPPVKLSAIKFIVVDKGASLTLEADARIKSFSGYDTKVATVQVVEGNPQQLRIQGISANATTITIQQEDQEPQSYDVRVKHDTRDIEMVLKQTFPGEAITVDAVAETTVLLKGSVSAELIRARAVSLVEQFYPSVLDHLEVRSATYEVGTVRSPNLTEQDTSTESLFQSVMRLSSRAAAIKADLNGETGELRTLSPDHPRAIEVRKQLNVGLAQIQAQAAEYQKFVASAANLAKSRLENARSDLDRHRQLSENGAVPVSEVRKSEQALAEAEAAFKQLTQIQEVLNSIIAPAADATVERAEN